MDAVGALLDSDTFDARIKCLNSFDEFLDDGIEVSTRLMILTLMSIKPRFVVICLQVTEV